MLQRKNDGLVIVLVLRKGKVPGSCRGVRRRLHWIGPNCIKRKLLNDLRLCIEKQQPNAIATLKADEIMEWDVSHVEPVAPLALRVQFADGTVGRVRFEPSHLTGVFTALKDPLVFQQARVQDGFVTWSGDLDLAVGSSGALKAKSINVVEIDSRNTASSLSSGRGGCKLHVGPLTPPRNCDSVI